MIKVVDMAKQDLVDMIANEAKEEQQKQVVRTKQKRFSSAEEKVSYIIEQNSTSNPGDFYFRGFDPVESYLVDVFVNERAERYMIAANSKDDALKKTLLFDTLIELTGNRGRYDVSRMSMKQFSQYFALNLVSSAMERLVSNPDETGERLFDAMTSSDHRSQLGKDPLHAFRRSSPLCDMVSDRYLSLFTYKDVREHAINAKNLYDLKYLLVTDIYLRNSDTKANEKTFEYLQKGQTKKAAAYVVLQSIKKDLFF